MVIPLFWTRSDDGSRLYIDGNLIVDNDGLHGNQNRMGRYNFPSAGKYPIRVTMFEQGGGESLFVKYRAGDWLSGGNGDGNYNAASFIPDNKLFLTGSSITNYYAKASGDLDDTASWEVIQTVQELHQPISRLI
ncbi:MAG: PA14 domain-containing protein [Cyclobacteriaceae bacterium]